MPTPNLNRISNNARNGIIVVLSALVISACAATGTSRNAARIEIQDKVGFTITERARISSNVRSDYAQALKLLEQGRHDEGAALLELVADATPELSAPRIDLGIAFHRVGDLEAAEKHLLLAIESNPNHPIAHNELGIVYRKSGRFTQARQTYESALDIYPGYHYARRNLAVLCDLYLVDLKCALENYEAYVATVPGDAEARMWIADIRNRMAQ